MVSHYTREFVCFLCGDKFASELEKDFHMGTCDKADGPNSLDRSREDPVRALYRQPVNHVSPSHYPIRYPSKHTQIDDFSAPVGSTRENYTQENRDMLRRINLSFKSKPTPAIRDPPSQIPQLTPYVQVAPRNPIFQNSNIFTGPTQNYTASAPLPESTPPYGYSRSQLPYAPRAAPPPPPLTELPFSQSHRSAGRHVSDPRSREDEMITLPPYDKDLSLVYKPEVELVKPHHVPPTQTYTREMMVGSKFEVKLIWTKQQPTLETTLEYLDAKDTTPILLKWEYRKEAFIASARLSAGEHRGSLAIPDSDSVVYEVIPFNVSSFSVSIQEIKIDLVEVAARYRNVPDTAKTPVYSQIDLASKRLSTNYRRDDQTQFVGDRNEHTYFQSGREKIVAPPGTDLRDKYVANRVELNLIPSVTAPLPVQLERPRTPPKYGADIIKHQTEINTQTFKPFNIVKEELSGPGEAGAFKSTQLRHEDRNQTIVISPPQEHPLPPPRHKPSVIADKSLDEEKRQTDALVAKLIAELASVKSEKERVEMEVTSWKTRHEEINKVNITLGKDLEDTNFALVREIKTRDDTKLQQTEKLDNEFEGKFKNLLDESQKKLQNLQSERDTYKTATYKYRGEREKVKQSYADAVQQIEVLTNSANQLKERNETLIQENNKLTGEVARAKLRAERNSSREHTFSPPANVKDVTSSLGSFIPVRAPAEDSGHLSLSSVEPSYEKKPVSDKYGSGRPAIPTKKPSISSHEYLTAYQGTASNKKLSSVRKTVEKFEGKPHSEVPVALPRYSKSSSTGLHTYQPEILSSSLQKCSSVLYRSSSVKTTKLSYLQRPEAHYSHQVLVKIQDVYRLGTLQIVFPKKFNFPTKTRILAGVKLDEAAGNSNGTFDSIRYFDCEPNHGIFISVEEVHVHVL